MRRTGRRAAAVGAVAKPQKAAIATCFDLGLTWRAMQVAAARLAPATVGERAAEGAEGRDELVRIRASSGGALPELGAQLRALRLLLVLLLPVLRPPADGRAEVVAPDVRVACSTITSPESPDESSTTEGRGVRGTDSDAPFDGPRSHATPSGRAEMLCSAASSPVLSSKLATTTLPSSSQVM